MAAIVEGPKYECLLFDMGDILYPLQCQRQPCLLQNIQYYLRDRLQIEESQIAEMCLELYKEYGTTMTGHKV